MWHRRGKACRHRRLLYLRLPTIKTMCIIIPQSVGEKLLNIFSSKYHQRSNMTQNGRKRSNFYLYKKNQVRPQNETVEKSSWKNYFRRHLRSKISKKARFSSFTKLVQPLSIALCVKFSYFSNIGQKLEGLVSILSKRAVKNILIDKKWPCVNKWWICIDWTGFRL